MSESDVGGPEPTPQQARPSHPPADRQPDGRAGGAWRVVTPVAVLLCGGLFAVSAANSDGTDLRPGRYTDLASLVQAEAGEYAELEDRVADLKGDVDRLTDEVDDAEVRALRDQIDDLLDPAGFEPRSGAGVSVTLSDAPEDLIEQAAADELDVNLLVVHQQDIQAVVNAMWAGGASAITIAGQRIITTTGIKCEGNAVQLQGVPYPQPYEIQAVGDPAAISAALESDPAVAGYIEDAADPSIQVGWDLDQEEHVEAPAYAGLQDLTYAKPVR